MSVRCRISSWKKSVFGHPTIGSPSPPSPRYERYASHGFAGISGDASRTERKWYTDLAWRSVA
jgi:hypothetical protein